MKLLILLFVLMATSLGFAQGGEFTTDNGLIYSHNAVKKLKHIVDSLNLKFKICETKPYYSLKQGQGSYVEVQGTNAWAAKLDMDNNISIDELVKKYPEAHIQNNFTAVWHTYKDYDDKDAVYIELLNLDPQQEAGIEFKDDDYNKFVNKERGWFFTFNPATSYSPAQAVGFYLPSKITKFPLHERYSRMVQYSECLVDTTAQVFLEDAKRSDGFDMMSNKKIIKLITYIDKKLKRPSYDESIDAAAYDAIVDSTTTDTATTLYNIQLDAHLRKMNAWEERRLHRIDSLMQYDKKFKIMFDAAAAEVIAGKAPSNQEIEEYIARYISKEQALYLKRNRRVVGMCSMDGSPRRHAMEIAELAAETTKWEIFLRSHLDIMNDRFDRVSDGSYAWAGRKTYIKELEVLGLNVSELLLGITIKVDNPSENHYYGSIRRIGRSMTEAEDRDKIEGEMLTMIADSELDLYNRLMIYYLFLNYNHNLDDIALQSLNSQKLEHAIRYMPEFIRTTYPVKKL